MDCLPPELLEKIFAHLDLEALRSAERTCSTWSQVSPVLSFYAFILMLSDFAMFFVANIFQGPML
jgi:hypothetical protein